MRSRGSCPVETSTTKDRTSHLVYGHHTVSRNVCTRRERQGTGLHHQASLQGCGIVEFSTEKSENWPARGVSPLKLCSCSPSGRPTPLVARLRWEIILPMIAKVASLEETSKGLGKEAAKRHRKGLRDKVTPRKTPGASKRRVALFKCCSWGVRIHLVAFGCGRQKWPKKKERPESLFLTCLQAKERPFSQFLAQVTEL
uniref:Uncharacterized protein n=1 Tax=Branchiostoma floridae TaxID=7739 RepID=C3Y4X4_BRAFL|eukprot:XP_002608771.1 hypothetical protein BRAFLDRAFT_73995 [Branchiostoma floridae]